MVSNELALRSTVALYQRSARLRAWHDHKKTWDELDFGTEVSMLCHHLRLEKQFKKQRPSDMGHCGSPKRSDATPSLMPAFC